MGLQSTPAYAQSIGSPANLDRQTLAAMAGARSGVYRYGNFALTPGGVTRQVNVAGGRAFIMGRENSQQGGYFVWSDASEVLSFPAPSASPRIDTLLLRVLDDQYGTITGLPRAYWDIVQGVPGASPSARPDSDFLSGGPFYLPGAWWRAADVRTNTIDTTVPAGQIYPTMDHVRVPGGDTLCLSTANAAGFGGRPTDPAYNDYIRETDTDIRRRWNGSAWVMAEPWKKTVTLGAAGALSVTGIPGTLREVRVLIQGRCNVAAAYQDFGWQVNNITGVNYRHEFIYLQNNTLPVGAVGNLNANSARAGAVPGTTGTNTTLLSAIEILFPGWNTTTGWLASLASGGYLDAASSVVDAKALGYCGATGPFTRLDFPLASGLWAAGSTVTVIGID